MPNIYLWHSIYNSISLMIHLEWRKDKGRAASQKPAEVIFTANGGRFSVTGGRGGHPFRHRYWQKPGARFVSITYN